jgi:hypothetical protein
LKRYRERHLAESNGPFWGHCRVGLLCLLQLRLRL